MVPIATAMKVQRRSRLDHSSKRSFPADSVNDMEDLFDIADTFLLTMPDREGEERRRLNGSADFIIGKFEFSPLA